MPLIPAKVPLVAKKMFPNYIWDIPTSEKTIYLTFDDGPTPEITHWTLNVLKKHKAKATFFCIGNNIEKHPDIFQDILKEGHAIGNHTYNHVKGWKTKTPEYIEEVLKTQDIIDFETNTTKSTNLFRPPYGRIKSSQGKKLLALHYKIIMWDILSFDWDQSVSPETCLKNVISKATNGSIIVFHDSVKASRNMQYALPKVLEYYSQKGFSFKALAH
ncbi:polysaccharide deacetylase family protein [Tamlana sp. 2_MG-2023]|uniref:polysaccharide deacetylase family protein n=1 Tax=unclassified Tamlana TaxID=2614803 RepID=UPI0026E1658D|nr:MULTISPECIES: polysaccharide deacetylase family protein [unclassified Tamlana]MDO6761059.1 polysaccharide deacetylase family protein [Tamlana sp. 2_MG-2023]MDO6791608.1 polysaccharide deacetylase family protein [Tamlana sp. 1_MG-2023]